MIDKKMMVRVGIYVAVAAAVATGFTVWKKQQTEKRAAQKAEIEAMEAGFGEQILKGNSRNKSTSCADGCAH